MGNRAEKTGNAIVKLLTEGHLDSLGFYDSQILADAWRMEDEPEGPNKIIYLIGSNAKAASSLKDSTYAFLALGCPPTTSSAVNCLA
jgi:hypothetical protein